jgi:positive regulator of sigma E activity
MSSEIIVVLVMIAIAIGGLVYLERHSRRNKQRETEQPESEKRD